MASLCIGPTFFFNELINSLTVVMLAVELTASNTERKRSAPGLHLWPLWFWRPFLTM